MLFILFTIILTIDLIDNFYWLLYLLLKNSIWIIIIFVLFIDKCYNKVFV